MIVFGQGAMRCHPYARAQVMGLESGDNRVFDRAFWGHMGHVFRNAVRATLLSLTRGLLAGSPVTGPTARYWRKLSWASAGFALLADIAMITLGGDLKRRERLSARLGDLLSWQYMATAVLHRYEKDGRREEDLPLAKLALEECFGRIQKAFEEVLANVPVPVVGRILRGPVLWWTRLNAIGGPPSDELASAVASALERPGEQRERLFDLCYLPTDPEQGLARIEQAFAISARGDAVAKKIRAAVKGGQLDRGRPEALIDVALAGNVITEEEATTYREALAVRWDVVQVDVFKAAEFAARTPTPGPETTAEIN